MLCLALVLGLGMMGVGLAHWTDTLTIGGNVGTGEWDEGGTIGFWKNWDNHNPYIFTEEDIEGWLAGISSGWFVVTTVEEMGDIIDGGLGEGHTMKGHFLAHYLATRLDVASGRLNGTTVHNFSGIDPGDYLGLGGYGTVLQIISAIESKVGPPWPNTNQYELMKDVCDALNNLLI